MAGKKTGSAEAKAVRVYTYTRVSTAMQIDGYSLEAQRARLKAFAEFNGYEIVGEYEDAGKSGKSIEGRAEFNQMMEDIKSGKDGVSFVLVFKLSRFGRNAADVLSTLQVMQDFGVNLICVEDGIDSSKDAGKLMISVLSAVAEIERENIRIQTMEGRIQKAREGKWNGGFAPYGYSLVDGQLVINEEEAKAVRIIFDRYVNSDMGSNGIARYLETHGVRKVQRQNGYTPLFNAALIRQILKNPVYCGKIAYGRRKTEKVHGTRNEYQVVWSDDYLLVDGLHEGIVSEEVWQAAQVKLANWAKKYEKVNPVPTDHVHMLTTLIKCPLCGAGMYGNKSTKRKKDGTLNKPFYYYSCKHRRMDRGHKCEYKRQVPEPLVDAAVREIIIRLVSNPNFARLMQDKINMKVDTAALEQEIAACEKQLRQFHLTKSKLIDEIDSLDPDDRHYIQIKADLDDRLYRMYDRIEEAESRLIEARAKKAAIEADKVRGDNIYRILTHFEKLYDVMNEQERQELMQALIAEIQIYEAPLPSGQWIKSIRFRLPIIDGDTELCLDNSDGVETVCSLSKSSLPHISTLIWI
ncbi:MAG: recombinase family protein [Clostridia bacterium]|nr:recombinase family protein [Clostridia bacterium]